MEIVFNEKDMSEILEKHIKDNLKKECNSYRITCDTERVCDTFNYKTIADTSTIKFFVKIK
jgi:hypothetical protein